MPDTLTSEGVVLAAVMMRRGGNRARLLTLIGGAPPDLEHFRPLSPRQAAYVLGVSPRHVRRLLLELVAAGVLERRPGAGSRPDAWRVRADVRRWDVLWPARRDADHVRLILADGGHIIPVEVPTTADLLRTSMGARNGNFVRTFMGAQEKPVLRTYRGAQEGPGLCAPPEVHTNSSSSSGAAGSLIPSHPRGGGKRRAEVEAFVDELARIVRRTTGRPVIGRGRDRLAALAGRLPFDRAERALAVLPAGAGWPMVVATLEAEAREPAPGDIGRPVTVALSWTVAGKPIATPRQFANLEALAAAALEPPADADPGSFEVSEPW